MESSHFRELDELTEEEDVDVNGDGHANTNTNTDSEVEEIDAELQHNLTVNTNLRPSYMDGAPDKTERPSSFDERIRKRLDDDLLNEDEGPGGAGEGESPQDRITTYLRIRPQTSKNPVKIAESEETYQVENPQTLVVRHQLKGTKVNKEEKTESRFTFTKVLGAGDSQSSVFEECMHPLLEKFFQGENCLVFSYGATNSGKTYTMQGYGVHFGVIPRTLEYLYNRLEECLYKKGNIKPSQLDQYFVVSDAEAEALERTKQNVLKEANVRNEAKSFSDTLISSNGSGSIGRGEAEILGAHIKVGTAVNLPPDSTLYCIWISFAEIYNEKVYDLFDRSPKKKEMKLVQNKQGQVYIKDLTECCAHTADEAYQLFLAGKQNLHSAATNMNASSSRSHSFFNIRMVAIGITGMNVYPKKILRITFCDLAGIERVNQTKNVGLRLKESGNINNSLMVLLRCIRAMRDGQNGKANNNVVLPFRESKLTRLFQSSLTAASRISMIASINPDVSVLDSTLQVLQNCAVASEVRTFKPVEFPECNTKFGRRLRASIALNESLGIKNRNGNARGDDSYESSDSESDDDDDNLYNVATVISKNNPRSVVMDKLKAENALLREKVRSIEMATRQEMQKAFNEILEKQDIQFNQLQLKGKSASQNLSKRRMSLAAKCFTEYPSLIPTIDENESDESKGSTNGSLNGSWDSTPRNSSESKNQNELKILSERNTELMDTIRELQENAAAKANRAATYQKQNKDIEAALLNSKSVEELRAALEVLHLKIGLVDSESKLNDLTSKVKGLEKEREDALKVCMEYHESLDLANEKIRKLTDDYNIVHAEARNLKFEVEMVHLAMSDIESQKDALSAKLATANERIGELEATIRNAPRTRSRSGKRGGY